MRFTKFIGVTVTCDPLYKTLSPKREVFNWTGNHNVAEKSETEYDNCNMTNVGITIATPVTITLTTEEDKYYICTVASHCSLGQKVKISLKSASGSPTLSPNSAPSSLAVGGFSAVLFSIVIAFLH
ncbi:hypothetical protein HHK36_021426 [Tetracentron sinense]|uniref:Phytocyanin domain-containing protein n=1 Tax=Tetracentron sinense TaxID=13715 RepID=A0A834YS47_TETSI|nr:hypothetical protein HHK36_021426 [Tetracentron sinense]